ncbi:MAG: flagellar motor protein MotB [Clostridia bacterium]|nr:flagellar motor protein MotB [Clostridia bacterium]
MAKKQVNKDAWLATYGDMITLILVFFVLLYSMSSIDEEKYRLLVKAFTADPETLEQIAMEETEERAETLETKPGAKMGSAVDVDAKEIEDLEQLYQYLQQYVQENNLESSVAVAKTDNMVYIRFVSTLFFEPDKAVLKPGGEGILDDLAPAMASVENVAEVYRIDGHTAEAAGSSTDDRALSTDRANAVLKYLEENYISDPSKLVASGFGRYRPVAPNDTEENMAQNRRVEILISKTDEVQDALAEIYKQLDGSGGTEEAEASEEGGDSQ